MSRDINPYALRLPEPVKTALKATAHNARRSLNAEIASRLMLSLKNDGITFDGDEIKEESKIYDVQPTVSTNIKFNERFTKKGVDNLVLAVAITAGEKYIQEQKAILSVEKKALLFAILYDFIDDEEPDVNRINNKTIDMLLKLAS